MDARLMVAVKKTNTDEYLGLSSEAHPSHITLCDFHIAAPEAQFSRAMRPCYEARAAVAVPRRAGRYGRR